MIVYNRVIYLNEKERRSLNIGKQLSKKTKINQRLEIKSVILSVAMTMGFVYKDMEWWKALPMLHLYIIYLINLQLKCI